MYSFSYSRSQRRFRWRYDGNEWLCDAIVGRLRVKGCDNQTGHIIVEARLILGDDGTAFVYRE